MNTYMVEIVAREWMRDRLESADRGRSIHDARLAAAAQAAEDFPPTLRESRLGFLGRRLAFTDRRLGLAIRRLAGAGAVP